MKTEPTEALSKLSRVGIVLFNCMYEPETEIIDKDTARQLIISAFSEGRSSPKIKQLEWDFYGTYYSAKTPVASYLITQEGEFIENYDDCELWVNASLILRGTHEEAKVAAQADFERRVKECLE